MDMAEATAIETKQPGPKPPPERIPTNFELGEKHIDGATDQAFDVRELRGLHCAGASNDATGGVFGA
jgi:hypothetical protein